MEFYCLQIEWETSGGTKRNCLFHLGGSIRNPMPNLGGTIQTVFPITMRPYRIVRSSAVFSGKEFLDNWLLWRRLVSASCHTRSYQLLSFVTRAPEKFKGRFPKKTSRESQNAALRTSHRLSNVSNCSFQKNWESKFKNK